MKNLKPSQLPVNTMIMYKGEEYIKRQHEKGDYWTSFGCSYCYPPDAIADAGAVKDVNWYKRSNPLTETMTSDEYFSEEEFVVMSIPPDFIYVGPSMHGKFDIKSRTFEDGTPAHDCEGFNCND
jgi:hypothetical protein